MKPDDSSNGPPDLKPVGLEYRSPHDIDPRPRSTRPARVLAILFLIALLLLLLRIIDEATSQRGPADWGSYVFVLVAVAIGIVFATLVASGVLHNRRF